MGADKSSAYSPIIGIPDGVYNFGPRLVGNPPILPLPPLQSVLSSGLLFLFPLVLSGVVQCTLALPLRRLLDTLDPERVCQPHRAAG